MNLNTDTIIATAHLCARAGAIGVAFGYTGDQDGPMDEALWYAYAEYTEARITVENHASPTAAAQALAERLIDGATCRCGQLSTLSDAAGGCRWQLQGKRWLPGCDAPPVPVPGVKRGDWRGMEQAMRRRADG